MDIVDRKNEFLNLQVAKWCTKHAYFRTLRLPESPVRQNGMTICIEVNYRVKLKLIQLGLLYLYMHLWGWDLGNRGQGLWL